MEVHYLSSLDPAKVGEQNKQRVEANLRRIFARSTVEHTLWRCDVFLKSAAHGLNVPPRLALGPSELRFCSLELDQSGQAHQFLPTGGLRHFL